MIILFCLSSSQATMAEMVVSVTQSLNKPFDLNRFESFSKSKILNHFGLYEISFNVFESIKSRVGWSRKNIDLVYMWLKKATKDIK